MSYKPTRQNRYKVSPIGSGSNTGSQFAQHLNNISGNLSSIANVYRKQQFDDAKLKAVADAQINAVNYTKDKDGKLTLNNLSNFNFDYDLNDKRDQRQINAFYKSALIENYGNALIKDAKSFVDNKLAQNPTDFKGIMASMEGYIQGKNLDADAELKKTVLPSIMSQFAQGSNVAKAKFTQLQRKENLKNIEDVVTLEVAELKAINANGVFKADQKIDDKANERAKEIIQGFDKHKANWILNGGTESDWKVIQKNKITEVIAHTNKTVLKDIFLKDGHDDAFKFISELATALETNPKYFGNFTVNPKILLETLNSELKNLATQKRLDTEEKNKNEKEISDRFEYKMKFGDTEITASEIDALPISNPRKNNLYNLLLGIKKTRLKENIDSFVGALNRLENPNAFADETGYLAEDVREDAISEIETMYLNKDIGEKEYAQYLKTNNAIESKKLKAVSKDYIANLRRITDPSYGYRITPAQLNLDISEAQKKRIVGNEDTATILEIQNRYKKAYRKDRKEKSDLYVAQEFMTKGFAVPSSHMSVVKEKMHKPNVTFVSVDGSSQTMPINLLATDSVYYNESFNQASSQTVSTKVLDENFVNVFKNAPYIKDEDTYNRTVELFENLKVRFDEPRKPGSGQFIFQKVLSASGIDYGLLNNMKFLGREDFVNLNKNAQNYNRKITTLNIADNSAFEEKVISLLPKALQDNNMLSFLPFIPDDRVSRTQDILLDKYRNQLGIENLSEIALSNPRVKSLIMSKIKANFADNKYPDTLLGLENAITQSFAELSGTIGLQENNDGTIEWTMYPIMEQAKSSMYEFGLPEIDDNDQIKTFVITDAIEKINTLSTFRNAEIQEAVNDGKLKFIVNEPFGVGKQTYTVYAQTDDGDIEVLYDYKYDFKTSTQNADYMKALNKVNNATVRKAIAGFVGLQDKFIKDTFLDLAENNDYDAFLKKIIFKVNRVGQFINPEDAPVLNKNDIEQIQNVLEYIPGY